MGGSTNGRPPDPIVMKETLMTPSEASRGVMGFVSELGKKEAEVSYQRGAVDEVMQGMEEDDLIAEPSGIHSNLI